MEHMPREVGEMAGKEDCGQIKIVHIGLKRDL